MKFPIFFAPSCPRKQEKMKNPLPVGQKIRFSDAERWRNANAQRTTSEHNISTNLEFLNRAGKNAPFPPYGDRGGKWGKFEKTAHWRDKTQFRLQFTVRNRVKIPSQRCRVDCTPFLNKINSLSRKAPSKHCTGQNAFFYIPPREKNGKNSEFSS